MNPYSRFSRGGPMGRLGDTGASSGLPQTNIPAQAGGSIVQGDGFYYIYDIIPAASIANGVTSTVTQQFDQVTVFKWVRTTFYCDLAGAAQTESTRVLPLVTLKITDIASGFAFMNNPIPLFTMAGAAELPYVLPTPQFILANAVLQFTFANISAATTYTGLQVQLHGYKLYNYSGQAQG